MCFVGGVIPYGGEKTHKQNPQKSRDGPVKSLFLCFFFVGFLLPIRGGNNPQTD